MSEARKDALTKLAGRKAKVFMASGEFSSLALTGSLARDMVWEGSDLDFWGFVDGDEGNFRDGVEDGIYWEIDIAPASKLDIEINADTWLSPPPFALDDDRDEDGIITLLEALSGCTILYDRDGKLARIKSAIDVRLNDRAWLMRRADNYLYYASGALDALTLIVPEPAILYAREIATNYLIGAYWMRRGRLLSSAIRIPERLSEHPEIHDLYCEIFALSGQPALDEFMREFAKLPDDMRDDLHSDVYNEALPAAELGAVDGALRYLRFMMMEQALEEGHMLTVRPCLGFDANVKAQQAHIINLCRKMAALVAEIR